MNLRTFSAVILAAAIPAFGDEIRMKIIPQSGRFADAGDTDAVASIIDNFNADEGLHRELKETAKEEIKTVEQVPDKTAKEEIKTVEQVPDKTAKEEIKTVDQVPDETAKAEIKIVEQVPDDLGNPKCPTCKAVGFGDPHIVTFDGLSYDVHVKGELTFLKSADPKNDFTIQARTVAVKNHPQGPAVTTGVVVHEDSSLGLPDVQVSLGQGANSELATEFKTGGGDMCYVQLFVDKEAKSILGGTGAKGATVQVNGNRIVVEYPTTNLKLDIKVTSWRQECHFSIDYYLVDCRCDETLVGLLGQPDFPKDWTNDWHEHDGTPLPIPSRRSDRRGKKAYEYSRTWCVTAGESKFAYEKGMSHADFDECTGAKGDNNFEIDIGAIIEEFENTKPGVITQCTQDGDDEPDEGCLVDCFFGGEDACDEFTKTVANTATAPIVFPPEPEITLKVPETPPAGGKCPVCKAVGWGDPHIITFDGVSYDVHVKGELTFLKSLGARDFTIQARTAVVSNHPKGPAVTTGVVVHETGQPTIQVSLGSSSNSELATMFGQCPVQLFVNGVAKDIDDGTGLTDATVQVKGKRIVVEYINTQMRLDMSVKVWRNTCHFSVTYYLADCPCDGSLVGILGQPDGDWSNDWHEHDGTPVDIPKSTRDRRGKEAYDYSLTWCLTDAESHFTYEPNMSHADHDFCTGKKGDENYDIDIDEIIKETQKTKPAVIDKCTINNELDEGCVVECALLGDEACDEFLEVVKNTATAVITERPTPPPTKAPTKESTPPPVPDIPNKSNTNHAKLVSDNVGSQGDPHFKTWRNEHFEYHGQCDLVLAKDPKFADGLGLDVQIRTKLVRFWSYIKSAAIRIGNDVFEVEGDADGNLELRYWMNMEYQGPLETIGGFPIIYNSNSDAKKKIVHIDLSSKYPGVKIELSVFKEFIKVDFQKPTAEAFGNTVGMLGDFKSGKTLARDGVTEMQDFHELGNEWQVLPEDLMLFHKTEAPQFPKKCIEPEDPRGERRRLLGESSVSIEDAEKACASLTSELDRKDCIYDIIATQDLAMAGAY